MISKVMRLLGKEKLSKIKIKESFKQHTPKAEKMAMKLLFYERHGKFSQTIVVDKDNFLVDGYTTYIIAKSLNKKYMPVKREE